MHPAAIVGRLWIDLDHETPGEASGEICNLIQSLGRAHASLDGQAANVLPSLLQEGNQVVDGQHDVGDELVLGHANVANSDTHAQDLLQLELDGRFDLSDLGVEVLGVGDRGRELAGLGKTRTQETRDLLDQAVGGDEGIVLAGEFLDQLLVLVELLQVVGGHGVDAVVLGSVNVMLVTENADAHARTRHSWQLDGAGETLVTLRVIVLQADLKFDGLEEVSLFLVQRVVKKLLHVLAHSGDCDFRHLGDSLPEELIRFLW